MEPGLAPTATYRVQLNRTFTLRDALGIVPYLDRLGISHLYCSPVLRARAGSMHGYDVVDPAVVNPELGTDADLRALASALHDRKMGLLVDIVPNHMGVGPDNPYWEDLLMHGERSRWARWFDVDWEQESRVVLPVLSDDLDVVLARGDLKLELRDGAIRLCSSDMSWPLDTATIPEELQLAQFDPEAVDALSVFSEPGEGRARLRSLLDAQHYRLTSWRHAPDEINYRRFFDVNDLVALRTEDRQVFEETHALILKFVSDGVVDGLRVDHIDGLADPLGYLRLLGERLSSHNFLVVEKILTRGESLRDDWPVQGTTGYEFLNELEDLFISPQGFAQIEHSYRKLRRLPSHATFADVAYQGKVRTLTASLRPDVRRLARLLEPLVRHDLPVAPEQGGARSDRARPLVDGIVEFIAALPVYRTYVDARATEPHHQDRDAVERAIDELRRRCSARLDVAELIGDIILGRRGRSTRDVESPRMRFITHLQQVSGAAMAKGVEDTALYIYVPLVSRNEVGGTPDRPLGAAAEHFHAANLERSQSWPHSLVCTNTHDTKRSADLRARLDVFAAIPDEWQRSTARWRRLNRKHRSTVKGRLAPDTNTEYLLYQTLVGIWPPPRAGRRTDDLPDRAWRASACERLEVYMLKAAREAKVRTSWTEPNADYEQALKSFIGCIMEPAEEAPFLSDVARFVARVSEAGHWTSLSRVLIHLTAPGVPDLYQGDEFWNFALVDPDNRRPVDFDKRAAALEDSRPDIAELVRNPADPLLKILITSRILSARRQETALFASGSYTPLEVRGDHAGDLFAFARTHGGQRAVVVASRRTHPGVDRTGPTAWGTTEVIIPEVLRDSTWHSVLQQSDQQAGSAGGGFMCSEILDLLPIALLVAS